MEDRFNLQRFVKEQQNDYTTAYFELSQGRKRSHWMWWIFPQIIGLGMTATSKMYAIKSLEEAKAFLDHPYLGKSLREISGILLRLDSSDASAIFGYPDDLKLRSCMTLFRLADLEDSLFEQVLEKYYDGIPDSKTVDIVRGQ